VDNFEWKRTKTAIIASYKTEAVSSDPPFTSCRRFSSLTKIEITEVILIKKKTDKTTERLYPNDIVDILLC